MRAFFPVFVFACLATVAEWAPCQTQWTFLTQGPAFGGNGSTIAYDSARDRVVTRHGSDTWEFDGTSWALVDSNGPIYHGGVLAYDPVRQRVVLTGWSLATWEWDGRAWTLASGAPPPTAVPGGMVYHAGRATVVQFGGQDVIAVPSNELWEWDGVSWQKIPASNPPPIYTSSGDPTFYSTLAYDQARDKLVVFGSVTRTSPRTTVFNAETWEWDAVNGWRQVPAGGPGSVVALSYDESRRRVVLLDGGYIWEWDGSGTWQRRNAPLSAPGGKIAHDGRRQRCLVFKQDGETWAYSPVTPARYDRHGTGCPGSLGVPRITLHEPWTLPWTGDTLELVLRDLPQSRAFLATGFGDTSFGAFPLPLDLTPLGMPGCPLRIAPHSVRLLVGGGNAAFAFFAIPADPSLHGVRFYQQALVPDPGANTFGAVVSDSMSGVIGGK